MSLVGIIANPASGKDVRRLVSHAITVGNQQKVNVVRRVLLALHACGIERVEIMPDVYGIGERALHALHGRPDVRAMVSIIDMVVENTAEDSVRAAAYLRQAGAGCIISLGGDGTARLVARSCDQVPLLPLSTGTNNVVPVFVEGTVAGLAAAYVAQQPEARRHALCRRHKQLLVEINGQETDMALVDVALIATQFIGARAVWEPGLVRQVFVTRAQPTQIGLSAVIGVLEPVAPDQAWGASATLDGQGRQVLVSIAPGAIARLGVGQITRLEPGCAYPILPDRPAVLALDGERELELTAADQVQVKLDLGGPWIVDVEHALAQAVAAGAFEVH